MAEEHCASPRSGRSSADRRTSATRSGRWVCKRIRHTVTQPDRPEIRGMLRKVPHLVTFEEVDVVKLHHLKPAPGLDQGQEARRSW